jgi:hypothetical protein
MAKLQILVRSALTWIGQFRTAIWIVRSLGGGTLIAVVIGAVQKLVRSQLDWIIIGTGFLASGVLIYLAQRMQRPPVGLSPIAPSQTVMSPEKPTVPLGLYAKEVTVFTVQEARFLAFPAPSVYRNVVQVILTNYCDATVVLWSPLWENTTGEVPAQCPLGAGLERPGLGYPRKAGQDEIWTEPADSLTVAAGQTISCWIGLLEPTGEGIKRRLEVRRTGTLVLPIKTEGRLAVQRISI